MTEFSSLDVLLDSHLCAEIRQGMQKVLATAGAIKMSKLPRKSFQELIMCLVRTVKPTQVDKYKYTKVNE